MSDKIPVPPGNTHYLISQFEALERKSNNNLDTKASNGSENEVKWTEPLSLRRRRVANSMVNVLKNDAGRGRPETRKCLSLDQFKKIFQSSRDYTVRQRSKQPGITPAAIIWKNELTVSAVRSAVALANSQNLFENFFHDEVALLTEGMSSKQKNLFTKVANKKLDDILSQTFFVMKRHLEQKESFSARTYFRNANKLAIDFLRSQELYALEAKTENLRQIVQASKNHSIRRPQIFARPEGGYNIVSSPVKLKNLAFVGGGPLGMCYPPALDEMRRAGYLESVKQVSGSSIGAVAAVILSVNMPTEEALELNLTPMFKSDAALNKIYPDISFIHQYERVVGRFITEVGNGQLIVQKFDKVTANKVMEVLKELAADEGGEERLVGFANDFATKHGLEASDVAQRLSDLRTQDYTKVRSKQMITFRDMQMLHALSPENFREVHLTAYDMQERKGKYMNVENTPDMPVAYALRASIAHPGLTSAVRFETNYGHQTLNHGFTDGGTGTNVPLEAFYGGSMDVSPMPTDCGSKEAVERGQLRARTALLLFDNDGLAYDWMHSNPVKNNSIAAPLYYKFFGVTDESRRADANKAYVSNTFVVFHGEIGLLDTSPKMEKARFAKALSRYKMLEQIVLRMNQLNIQQVDNVEQAYRLLSEKEKDLLITERRPDEPAVRKEESLTKSMQGAVKNSGKFEKSERNPDFKQKSLEADKKLCELAKRDGYGGLYK